MKKTKKGAPSLICLCARPASPSSSQGRTGSLLLMVASIVFSQWSVIRHGAQFWLMTALQGIAPDFFASFSFSSWVCFQRLGNQMAMGICTCVFLPLVCSSRTRANRGLLLCILRHLLDLLYPEIIRRPRAWMPSPTSKACSFQMASRYLFEYPRPRIPIVLLPIRSISSMRLKAGQHNAQIIALAGSPVVLAFRIQV